MTSGAERVRPGRDHDRIGALGEDVVDPRLGAQPHVDSEPVELALEEQDDLLEVVARRGPYHEVHLAAETGPAFEQHDLVPALGRGARGFHAGRPAPHDHHPAALRGRRQHRPLPLAAGDRVVDAPHPQPHVEVPDAALGARDAGADVAGAAPPGPCSAGAGRR